MTRLDSIDWLTPEQATARLGCTQIEFVRLVADARIRAHHRFLRDDLLNFIKQPKIGGAL